MVCCRISSLHSSLIFYLRGTAGGFTRALCLHVSVEVQCTAYRHAPTNSFEAGKIVVSACVPGKRKNRPEQGSNSKRVKELQVYGTFRRWKERDLDQAGLRPFPMLLFHQGKHTGTVWPNVLDIYVSERPD